MRASGPGRRPTGVPAADGRGVPSQANPPGGGGRLQALLAREAPPSALSRFCREEMRRISRAIEHGLYRVLAGAGGTGAGVIAGRCVGRQLRAGLGAGVEAAGQRWGRAGAFSSGEETSRHHPMWLRTSAFL